MIALIAAVPLETEILRRDLWPCEVRSCGRRDLFIGSLCAQPVALLHTGVGKAGAAAATALLLELYRPTAVLVFGCGGAYPKSTLAVGDLALATEDRYGDEGAQTPDGFLDMQGLGFPLAPKNGTRCYDRFPVDGHLLEKAERLLGPVAAREGKKLASGPFVTVSTCSGTDARGRELEKRTGGICENMEGAAVAQICYVNEVPFLEVRGISNLTENRDLSRWDLRAAAEMAQQAVLALLAGWDAGMDSA